ncbi:MAG: 50S ribosomal protein L17 [Synergistales bacterium]|nr:50S ribosomal protein L17 [Synergistales bacterium]
MDHKKLGRYGSHRKSLLANLASELFEHGTIRTTQSRAGEVRRFAEKLITRAKGGSIHDRRMVRAKMPHKDAMNILFNELAPRYANRPGGYTRIVKLGSRKGDAAPMAILELVE